MIRYHVTAILACLLLCIMRLCLPDLWTRGQLFSSSIDENINHHHVVQKPSTRIIAGAILLPSALMDHDGACQGGQEGAKHLKMET